MTRTWLERIGGIATQTVLAGAALFPAGVAAEPALLPSGPGTWYLGAEGGWTRLENARDRIPGIPFTQTWHSGFNLGTRAGYQWGPWRLEEEFRYQRNDAHKLVEHPAAGYRASYGFMGNLIYDLDLGWPVSPHVGAGVGVVGVEESVRIPVLGISKFASGTDWVFGFQGLAGMRYNITPAFAVDVDYRYLQTDRPQFRTPPQLIVDGLPRGNLPVSSRYGTHSLVASLSWRLGVPPAVAAPPPVVPPPALRAPAATGPKVFLVFFDWDSDRLSPAGSGIVRQAAEAWRAGRPVTVQITGYTDASGSAGYNQRLSERRADAVARALAGFGVPRSSMSVSGRGKSDPRVPTVDGVREPQNRRVEIAVP